MSVPTPLDRAQVFIELTADDNTEFDRALERVLRADARALHVERVGLWLLADDPFRLSLVSNYAASEDAFDSGLELLASAYPSYFSALDSTAFIAADDAQSDARTAEFTESYLKPLGIGAMLDVPVWSGGRPVGVVCHEHVGGPRRWSDEEQSFAVSVGAVVSSLLETRARREAERRIEVLADDAEAAKQLARARGEILAVVGHDLRGPLASIQTTASLLALDTPAEAETTHRRLSRIQRSVRFMERLISDLVDASRLEAGHVLSLQPTPERVDTLVGEALELVRDHARAKSIDLHVELGAGDLELPCDRDRILQALSNLLGNAVKFTPNGCRVSVSTARRDDGGVRISVEDEGPGIAREDLPHVFERYWHGPGGHTGLGLYIVKAVVDAHDGTIRVESDRGRGTTFVIELPAPPA